MTYEHAFEILKRRMLYVGTKIIRTESNRDNWYFNDHFPKIKLENRVNVAYNILSNALVVSTFFEDGHGKTYDEKTYTRNAENYKEFIVEVFGKDYLLKECKNQVILNELEKHGLI